MMIMPSDLHLEFLFFSFFFFKVDEFQVSRSPLFFGEGTSYRLFLKRHTEHALAAHTPLTHFSIYNHLWASIIEYFFFCEVCKKKKIQWELGFKKKKKFSSPNFFYDFKSWFTIWKKIKEDIEGAGKPGQRERDKSVRPIVTEATRQLRGSRTSTAGFSRPLCSCIYNREDDVSLWCFFLLNSSFSSLLVDAIEKAGSTCILFQSKVLKKAKKEKGADISLS